MDREALLARTFIELADVLVDDFDVVDLLTTVADRSVEVIDVTAAGVMLAWDGDRLAMVASSSDAMRLLEVFEEQTEEGPCPDCYRSGQPVINQQSTVRLRGAWSGRSGAGCHRRRSLCLSVAQSSASAGSSSMAAVPTGRPC